MWFMHSVYALWLMQCGLFSVLSSACGSCMWFMQCTGSLCMWFMQCGLCMWLCSVVYAVLFMHVDYAYMWFMQCGLCMWFMLEVYAYMWFKQCGLCSMVFACDLCCVIYACGYYMRFM